MLSCVATIIMTTPLDMIIAAPTHRDWWYTAEEHVKIQRASGISKSTYDLALLEMYSRYWDRFAPCYHRDETCDLHPSYELCDMTRTRLQDFNHENCCPLPFFRNMTKRTRTADNVEKLMIRFLNRSYGRADPKFRRSRIRHRRRCC